MGLTPEDSGCYRDHPGTLSWDWEDVGESELGGAGSSFTSGLVPVSSTGLLSSGSLSLQLGGARRETRTLATVKPPATTMFRLLPTRTLAGRRAAAQATVLTANPFIFSSSDPIHFSFGPT